MHIVTPAEADLVKADLVKDVVLTSRTEKQNASTSNSFQNRLHNFLACNTSWT